MKKNDTKSAPPPKTIDEFLQFPVAELPDNGFTDALMAALPERKSESPSELPLEFGYEPHSERGWRRFDSLFDPVAAFAMLGVSLVVTLGPLLKMSEGLLGPWLANSISLPVFATGLAYLFQAEGLWE